MKRFEIFDFFADEFRGIWRMSLIQGILFLLLGMMIFIFPQLLIAMVAAFFMIVGIVFLSIAWNARKFHKDYEKRIRVEIQDLFDF